MAAIPRVHPDMQSTGMRSFGYLIPAIMIFEFGTEANLEHGIKEIGPFQVHIKARLNEY